jgi:glycosyltransferase involved in cell wall biosynthesis
MIFGIDALSIEAGRAGGGETYLQELVAHLTEVDPENQYVLFVSAAGRSLFRTDTPNLRVITGPAAHRGGLRRIAVEQLWLPLAARRAGLNALLCPTDTIPRLFSGPTVMTVQNLLSSHSELWNDCNGRARRWLGLLKTQSYRAARGRSARRAAAVLAVSEQTRRETARYCRVDPARLVVARHGVSRQFRPVESPEVMAEALERYGLRKPFLLVVGRLSPYKNLDRVLEGLAQVRQWSHRLPMLALVGDDRFGCQPRLQRLALGLDLHDHVRFLGVLPQAALPALYSAAAASLSLSSCESFGLPIIESMACGCPVICARRSWLPEVAGQAALFVDPDRPQDVAEAIWRLVTLPNVRDAWVERGLERARQFDWHETARITRTVLIAVAEGRLPPQSAPDPLRATVEAADGRGRVRE